MITSNATNPKASVLGRLLHVDDFARSTFSHLIVGVSSHNCAGTVDTPETAWREIHGAFNAQYDC